MKLGLDVLPYSPDLTSSDYHLFRSLQNVWNVKNFKVDEDVRSYLNISMPIKRNHEVALKDSKRSSNKTDIILFNKNFV